MAQLEMPISLGSCFVSADVASLIQLAELLSDCRATSSLLGQPGSAAARHRHPVEGRGSAAGGSNDPAPGKGSHAACETRLGVNNGLGVSCQTKCSSHITYLFVLDRFPEDYHDPDIQHWEMLLEMFVQNSMSLFLFCFCLKTCVSDTIQFIINLDFSDLTKTLC